MAADLELARDLLGRFGYLIVFVAALVEALPLLSLLVPGQAVILVAGAAAALGILDLWLVILVAIPAGIIGDAVGFYVGRRYGRSILERYGPRFRITPRHLTRTDELFDKYGPFALVLFRFSFLTRPVGPLLGGISRLRSGVFWSFNVLGAVLWALAYGLLGYFFGVAFLEIQGIVGRILAWTLVGSASIYVFYRFLRRFADLFTRDDFYVALMGVLAGSVFGVLADRVQKLGRANALDAHAGALADALEPLGALFRVMEVVAAYEIIGVTAFVALVVLAARRLAWQAALVGIGIGGVILLVGVLRPIFGGLLPAEVAGGFPSEYASVSLVAAGVGTYIVASLGHRPRVPLGAAAVGASFTFLSALSRVAQGDELPSAVFAGLALGAAWLSLAILVVEFGVKRTPRPKQAGAGRSRA